MRQELRSSVLFLLGAAWPTLASSQQLPTWPLTEICAREPGQCLEYEAMARKSVTGGWAVLPDSYRTECLAEVKTPLDRSWRLLSQCLELRVLKGLDKKSIATAVTKSEPLPQPKSEDGIPAPPFALPVAPPSAN